MSRYKIIFSYDGSQFAGYQYQPKLRTIQGELEKAISYINGQKKTVVHSSGRTDALVHSLGQVAHFDLQVQITENKLKRALNSNLPNDIHVISAYQVEDDFHARYMVASKEYEYIMNLGEYNPLERCYVYQCCHSLDLEAIRKALSYLEGTHDFRAFVSENKNHENCVRTIYETSLAIDTLNPSKIHIYFKGSGFLKYQVRNMVGTLIRIGEGKMEPERILAILESKNRMKAGRTAPACGLYLVRVNYDV